MRTDIVFTLTGTDRVGIVNDVTKLLLDLGGNIENSRMARLGGAFAMLLLVSLPTDQMGALDKAVATLTAQGFKITTVPTQEPTTPPPSDWVPYEIHVLGADHEGIIQGIAQYLAQQGINIEFMETQTTLGAESATPLFEMIAYVLVPPAMSPQDLDKALETATAHLHVDVQVNPVTES